LPDLIRFRRMIGLFAFFYASLHFATWFGLDKFFDVHEILADFTKRRFIIAGLTAFLCMVPLAVTSTKGWIRRLGGRRWQSLHRLVYVTAIAAVVHYYWLVKSDVRLPLLYGSLVAILLAYRAGVWWWKRRASAAAPAAKRVPSSVS
jgi:sulfoxide reductase heme-binding subunit YedZ